MANKRLTGKLTAKQRYDQWRWAMNETIPRLEEELARATGKGALGVVAEERDALLSLPEGEELVEVFEVWAKEVLVVPSGVKKGEAFELAEFQKDFLRLAFSEGKREALLTIGRKNGKTGLVASLLLCILCGPLNVSNFCATVVSANGHLAKKIPKQMEEFLRASPRLGGIEKEMRFRYSNMPGAVVGLNGANVEVLAAGYTSGHGEGADLAIIDELGLLGERHREIVSSAFSSTASRDGRLLALSIRGHSPMLKEMLAREGMDQVHISKFFMDKDGDKYSEDQWLKANPGLSCGIKSWDFMRAAAVRARTSEKDEAFFFAQDLNEPGDPYQNILLKIGELRRCEVSGDRVLPERKGKVVIGFDIGENKSMSSACGLWPESGRCEFFAAFPDTPGLFERGESDQEGRQYLEWERKGYLVAMPGRIVDVYSFIERVVEMWGDGGIDVMIFDRYKHQLARQSMDRLRLKKEYAVFRNRSIDQTYDLDCAQRLVVNRRVTYARNDLFYAAVGYSRISYGQDGSMKLEKQISTRRVDMLSAFSLAAGGMEHALANKPQKSYVGWIKRT